MAELQVRSLDRERYEVNFAHPAPVPTSLLVRDNLLELDLLTIAGDNHILSIRGSFERILDFLSSIPFRKELVQEFLSDLPDGEGI